MSNERDGFEYVICECVKETLKETLKEHAEVLKGKLKIEEWLYPYINACVFNKLKNNTIKRLGWGRVCVRYEIKPDFILETDRDLILGELKLEKSINDLMFGFQARKEERREELFKKLAEIVQKDEDLFGVKLCDSKAGGKKKISDGFLIDILKLRDIILGYKLYEEKDKKDKKNIYSVAIGVTLFKKEYEGCIEKLREKLNEGIGKVLKDEEILLLNLNLENEPLAKSINKSIKYTLNIEPNNDFILFKCYLYLDENEK